MARYTGRLAGIDSWALMLFDVLSGLESVAICTGYECDGETLQTPPSTISRLSRCRPIAKDYIKAIEDATGISVGVISVGPDRGQTIVVDERLKEFLA